MAARYEDFAGHPQLAAPREERRAAKGGQSNRKPEERPFDQGTELAVPQDVRGTRQQGGNESIAETQLATESDRSRLLDEKGIRTSIDHPAVESLRPDDAAGPRCRLEHADAQPALLKLVCRGEARDPAANDGDVEP
jgi:hypothetical protein